MSMHKDPEETPERTAYYDRIGAHNLAPLWTVFRELVTPEPVSACAPCPSTG